MAAIDDLLNDYRRVREQMLDDVKFWRANGWHLHKNNEDITEKWLSEQTSRAEKLAKIIAAYEKRND